MKKITARKRRNRKLNCWCDGWWWGPHRRGSKASPHIRRTKGTDGCLGDGVPF